MKLEKLEALRGFAAVYVVLHHTVPHGLLIAGIKFGLLFRFGQEAVILFFLLSGFVINYSYRRGSDKSFRTYFIKRGSRIYIPLLVVMFLGWFLESLKAGGLEGIQPRELVLNLLMLQDVKSLKPNVIVSPYMHNTPLWSLSYEWWFYMLYFPIQKLIANMRTRDFLVVSLAVISAVAYLYYPTFVPRLLMYMSIWWAGVFISNLYLDEEAITIKSLVIPLGTLGLVSAINLYAVFDAMNAGENVRFGLHPVLEFRHHIFALSVILGAVMWKYFNWYGFRNIFNAFLWAAPISYSIYISHYYFISSANYLSFIGLRPLEVALYFIPMIIFSYLVERRLFPWGQKLILSRFSK